MLITSEKRPRQLSIMQEIVNDLETLSLRELEITLREWRKMIKEVNEIKIKIKNKK